MIGRLQRLVTTPKTRTLTPEEQAKFARLDIDPTVTWRRGVDVNDRICGHHHWSGP